MASHNIGRSTSSNNINSRDQQNMTYILPRTHSKWHPHTPLYICFLVPMFLKTLLFSQSMFFLLGLRFLMQLLVQYAHDFLFVLVVGILLMNPHLYLPLFLLLLLLMLVKDSFLLCAFSPLLFVLILEGVCGCHLL